jgi:hypothetical protein
MEKQVVGGNCCVQQIIVFLYVLRDIDNYDTGDLVKQFGHESSTIFVYCLSLKDFKISNSRSSGNKSFDVTEAQNYASPRIHFQWKEKCLIN